MKKEELLQALEEQKKETELWKKRYLSEKEKQEATDEASELRHLRNTLAFQQNMNDMNKTLASIKEQESQRLKEENRLLKEDNERLLEDFKFTYRPGIVERERLLDDILSKEEEWTKYQIDKLKKENSELKEKLEKQEMTISFLKAMINDRLYNSEEVGNELQKIYKRTGKPGKAQVDEATKRRVQYLKGEGFSIRKIAEIERISVGCVHKIIHES